MDYKYSTSAPRYYWSQPYYGGGLYYIEVRWNDALITSYYTYSVPTSVSASGFTYTPGDLVVGSSYYVGRNPIVLDATAGSVTIVGTSQTLLRDAIIVPSLGEFAITGTAASVLWNHVLDASITWEGSLVDPIYCVYVQYNYVTAVYDVKIYWNGGISYSTAYATWDSIPDHFTVGEYIYYVGSLLLDSNPNWYYKVRRESGIIGTAMSPLWGHVIVPDEGTFTISGKAAYPTRFNAHIDVDAGSMVIAGQPASLFYTGSPVYVDMTVTKWKMKKTANNTYTLQECSDVVRSNTGL